MAYDDEFIKEAEDRPVIAIEVVLIALIIVGFVFWEIWKLIERGG